MLSTAQLEARTGKLTASRVACLMTGDAAAVHNLWLELVGSPSFVREDLSEVWPVRLGEATEDLQLDWFELKKGPVVRRGEVVQHANGWAACTLDGWSSLHDCPIETKHCGGYEPFEMLIDRYQPQLHWQMFVTGADRCVFSAILGARPPVVDFIERNDEYAAELVRRAAAFMDCVNSLREPVKLEAVEPPPPPGKIYDMQGSNSWADQAAVWLEHAPSRKKADEAEKSLKAMVPADAVKCEGHGIKITRSKNNALSLREKTQ